ncbi:2351_t:CDS:2 [Scutellospora calospora]|uniref:2351_t:CDS:1 n=1 Tax=Scutellospora calospora TaxID=85575 RepID=A0ACA9LWG7_9GLOM|nr:2351_t:CDS:2 [Scutellospora calospora]
MQEVFSPDEIFEDSEDNNNTDTVELINEMRRGRQRGSRGGKNIVSEKKDKISSQLPTLPDFDYFKHNVLFHQGGTLAHRQFRLQLAWDFVSDALNNKESHVACIWCQWEAKKNNQNIKEQNPPQSQIWCTKCNVALCCNISHPLCFEKYHTYIDE